MNRQRLIAISILVAAGAITLATASLATASARSQNSPVTATAAPTQAALGAIRDRVQRWLTSSGFKGFRVSEVMAFSNNNYAAVNDKTGKPAFELLVASRNGWLMEEPASMMWNTRYGMLGNTSHTLEPIPGMTMMWGGMMGGGMMGDGMMGSPSSWYRIGTGKVSSLPQAVTAANKWLAKALPGETAETDGRAFPGYFTMDTIRSGKTAGMLSVNASTGSVWYHGWHGTFLGERMFTS